MELPTQSVSFHQGCGAAGVGPPVGEPREGIPNGIEGQGGPARVFDSSKHKPEAFKGEGRSQRWSNDATLWGVFQVSLTGGFQGRMA